MNTQCVCMSMCKSMSEWIFMSIISLYYNSCNKILCDNMISIPNGLNPIQWFDEMNNVNFLDFKKIETYSFKSKSRKVSFARKYPSLTTKNLTFDYRNGTLHSGGHLPILISSLDSSIEIITSSTLTLEYINKCFKSIYFDK